MGNREENSWEKDEAVHDTQRMPAPLRLQVYLARCGIGSRRACESYIEKGRVSVNGVTITSQGIKVTGGDIVRFDGEIVEPESTLRYIALHKPPGYISSSYDPEGRPLAVDLLAPSFDERLYNIGRLDCMSEGLLLFTNDGSFAQKAGHPSFEIEKEYTIEFLEALDSSHRAKLEESLASALSGISVEGTVYTIESYTLTDRDRVSIILKEGKNREIRRLFSYFDIGIRRLIRKRIGPVHLGSLGAGKFRPLTEEEKRWFLSLPHKK